MSGFNKGMIDPQDAVLQLAIAVRNIPEEIA